MRLDVLLLGDHGDVVVLALSLGQQLEPTPGPLALPELRHTETRKRKKTRPAFNNVKPKDWYFVLD